MKNRKLTLKTITLFSILGMMFSSSIINAQQNEKYGAMSYNKAVNISGKQCMLTQKMAKAYLYLIKNPNDVKAKRDLATSKIIFEKQNSIIIENASYKITKEKVAEVETLWKDFKELLDSKPSYFNGKRIVQANTALLLASNAVVSSVILESKWIKQEKNETLFEEEDSGQEDIELKKIINIAGRQRMLAQRLALYYYANDSTLKNKDSQIMLNNVFNEFDDVITTLLISNFNNSKVDEKLGIAMSKWEEIKNNREKLRSQGFSAKEVYKLSNDLTKVFNDVTSVYEHIKL